MSVVTTKPDDSAVASRTDETDAPTPAPAAAPHTMNTYKNDAKHSAIIDLKNGIERTIEIYLFFYFSTIKEIASLFIKTLKKKLIEEE